jgi:hypothetical protein
VQLENRMLKGLLRLEMPKKKKLSASIVCSHNQKGKDDQNSIWSPGILCF